MSDVEIEAMVRFLQGNPARRVLEWGAGGSTICYPAYCDGLERWLSIEHDEEWYRNVLAENRNDKVEIRYVPAQADFKHDQQEWDDVLPQFDNYIKAPIGDELPLNRYQIIIVDGRARNLCMITAKFILEPGGFVILHDSDVLNPFGKLTYARGMELFKTIETAGSLAFMTL